MNTILALDIGSEYVKTILAYPKKTGLEIIGATKTKQSPDSMINGIIHNLQAVISTCEKSLIATEEQAKERANSAVVGLANESVKANTTVVRYNRKNPEKPIAEDEMTEIIKKVQQKSGEVAKKTIALETGDNNMEIRLINSAIVSLIIDGYEVDNPIGFKGANITIQFYTAFAPLIYIDAIEKICAELNIDLLAVAVNPFAVCRACLGENLDSNLSSIIIDIGSHITDTAIINDGGVIGTKTFTIGIDKAKNNPNAWLSGVEISLDEAKANSLPNNILLCGGGSHSDQIQEAIATFNWYKKLPFNQRPIIDILNVTDLPDTYFGTKINLDNSFTAAIGLLRIGTDTITNSPEKDTLKTKISKLLQK